MCLAIATQLDLGQCVGALILRPFHARSKGKRGQVNMHRIGQVRECRRVRKVFVEQTLQDGNQ